MHKKGLETRDPLVCRLFESAILKYVRLAPYVWAHLLIQGQYRAE